MIRVGWLKWRLAYKVLWDWRTPTRLEEIFYKTTNGTAMTYVVECWPIRKQHMQKVSVAEMRMLRLMYGKSRKDRLKMNAFGWI